MSSKFEFPHLSRDQIKEILFDHLGVQDREWSQSLGRASHKILTQMLIKVYQNSGRYIVENNFDTDTARSLGECLRAHQIPVLERLLTAPDIVILSRFRARWESGERHPGHEDHNRLTDLQQALTNGFYPINIGSTCVSIDTDQKFEEVF